MNYRNTKAVNASFIKACLRSPLHGFEMISGKFEQTDSMALGSLAHHFILEPNAPLDAFVFAEEKQRFSQEQKDQIAATGKTLVRPYQVEEAKAIARAVADSTPAMTLLTEAKTEQELFFELSGVPCKAKVDAYKGNALIDVKTCNHQNLERFPSTVVNFDYHTQLAFYDRALSANGTTVTDHYIIAVTNAAPYLCKVFKLNLALINAGHARIMQGMPIAYDILNGFVPGQDNTIHEITVPKWMEIE